MNLTFRQVSKNLQISYSTACRVFARFKETGDVLHILRKKRPELRSLDDHHELLILGLIIEKPSLYLKELCYEIYQATGVSVSGTTVCRVLRRNGFTRKKVQVAKQRCNEYRALFLSQVLDFNLDMFVWIDETGSDSRTNIRRFGYSIIGETPIYHRFLVRGERISAIVALCSDGIISVELTKGTVNGNKFYDFIRSSLIPNMHQFDGSATRSIAVMDNCTSHHVEGIRRLFREAGILLLFFATL